MLNRAMRNPDKLVVKIEYRDRWGETSIRTISPIRFVGNSLLALCLGQESPRRFDIPGIKSVEIVSADDVLMPEPIERPIVGKR